MGQVGYRRKQSVGHEPGRKLAGLFHLFIPEGAAIPMEAFFNDRFRKQALKIQSHRPLIQGRNNWEMMPLESPQNHILELA
jgi:hypothetical protein